MQNLQQRTRHLVIIKMSCVSLSTFSNHPTHSITLILACNLSNFMIEYTRVLVTQKTLKCLLDPQQSHTCTKRDNHISFYEIVTLLLSYDLKMRIHVFLLSLNDFKRSHERCAVDKSIYHRSWTCFVDIIVMGILTYNCPRNL